MSDPLEELLVDRDGELLTAVTKYIESRGGSVLVVGGVDVIRMPNDLKYNYRLCVRIMGALPDPILREEAA